MPKRPGKKGMEVIPGPLWVADEDEEEEEVVRPAPAETVSVLRASSLFFSFERVAVDEGLLSV